MQPECIREEGSNGGRATKLFHSFVSCTRGERLCVFPAFRCSTRINHDVFLFINSNLVFGDKEKR